MAKLYIFRGKAATGKSTITELASNELMLPVLRKDDVYDLLAEEMVTHATRNKLAYAILAKIINTNLKNNCELIIDISLGNPLHLNEFLAKLDLKGTEVKRFLCICSDEEVWKKRIEDRVINPTPNQLFKSADEAVNYYKKVDIKTMDDEVVLDSSEQLSLMLEKVKKELAKGN